jgi:VWFA-related protein
LPAQQPDLVLRGGTQEVLLDFVVRDKHQKLVKDLRPEDVQIFEDGVRQNPRSFVFRAGQDVSAASAGALNAPKQTAADPLREINLVTLVFEAMSPLSRRTAVERAHEFLKAETGPNTWMAVYSLRYQLSVQQPYTTDLALLHKAVDRAGTGAYQQFAKESLNIAQRMNSLQSTGRAAAEFSPLDPGSAEERGPQNDQRLSDAETQIRRPDGTAGGVMQQLILATILRQEGSRSIDALHTLIREQGRLPGRKTILFFSEGLVTPAGQPELLDSVIAAANRANVTFYTVDSRGLTTISNSRVSLATSSAISAAEQGAGAGADNRVGAAVYQTDLQANARHLAEGTGGFAMDNSNDLRGSLRRVMEDVRSHYEVTYSPTSENYDGHFRKLEVKLSVPGLKVQSRAGYYALPLVSGTTIAPYEMAALNAINREPAPHSFPYTAGALRFGADALGVDCRIVFAVPANSLHFTEDPAKKSFQIHISVLGLIKDERGQIVAKVSNDLPFRAPVEKQANFAQGKVTLALPVHLPAGRYQLQTVVIDREADTASVKRSVLMIPAGSARMSDIVWVRSVETGQPEPGNALETPQGKITPELEPVFARTGSAAFYFISYGKAEAAMTVARDGKVITTDKLPAPGPDESGAYRYSVTLPLSQLEPGQYELVIAAGQSQIRSMFEVR